MKKSIVLMCVIALVCVLSSLSVIGAECGSVPTSGCTVSISTSFNTDIYHFNSTTTYNGAIRIASHNITLDCNGSTLIGNSTDYGSGISNTQSTRYNNVTIKNCIIQGYRYGIDSLSNYTTIYNNTISNCTAGIYLERPSATAYSNNNNISSNKITLINLTGGSRDLSNRLNSNNQSIYAINQINLTVEDNILINSSAGINCYYCNDSIIKGNNITGMYDSILDERGNNNLIENNIVECFRTLGVWYAYGTPMPLNYVSGIISINTTNLLINSNDVSWCTISIKATQSLNNANITNNLIEYSDRGIALSGNNKNIIIDSNNITNASLNTDFYSVAIFVSDVSNSTSDLIENIIVTNNRIEDYGNIGILFRRVRNLLIDNNYFKELELGRKNILGRCAGNTSSNCDKGEPPSAIRSPEPYKGWDDSSKENNNMNLSWYFNGSRSYNITITNNIFSSSTQIFLWNTNGINITHDLTDYWYRAIQFPKQGTDWLTDKDEFYINNIFDDISQFDDSISTTLRKYFTGDTPQWNMTYKVSKTVMIIKNTHITNNQLINLTNLTDQPDSKYVQIFNQTSTTPTAENVNTFTETIPANNRSFVFSYLTAFQPKFSEIGLGITDITPNYDSTQKNFSFDCTGTGDIKVTNLNDLDGKYGYVEVRHNGTFKEYVEPDYYTVSTCSNWQFLTTDYGYVASDGGISPSSSSGGCWGLARAEDTCYYINDYGECIKGCLDGYSCNSSYDFDSLTGETLDYCISDETVTTPPPTPKDTIEKIKDKLKEADTRIEQGIEKVLGISKPPRGQLEMFFVYSYLRFKENVINKIFFGSWILFSVLAFVITISSIEIITKVKKKKKKEKKKF